MKHGITIFVFVLGICASACNPEIGDDCQYDADCSPNLDRHCDRSQPGGYCLIIGCGPDECPKEASCVEYTTPCPKGEGYEEGSEKCQLLESNRGRTYCMQHCKKDNDCRDKYKCRKVDGKNTVIIDFKDQRSKICVPKVK
jgi:hypothetical protein